VIKPKSSTLDGQEIALKLKELMSVRRNRTDHRPTKSGLGSTWLPGSNVSIVITMFRGAQVGGLVASVLA